MCLGGVVQVELLLEGRPTGAHRRGRRPTCSGSVAKAVEVTSERVALERLDERLATEVGADDLDELNVLLVKVLS